MTFHSQFSIGQLIRICGDKSWVAIVSEVSFAPGKTRYRLTYRVGYELRHDWYTYEEIMALNKLGRNMKEDYK